MPAIKFVAPVTANHTDHAQVLDGVDVSPLLNSSTGADEAARLGYSTKLVSNWYHHRCQYNSCQQRWSEFAVVDDDEVDLKQRSLKIPIIHRHKYINKHWVAESITVQDPSMQEVLTDVLQKYQDLDLEVENWTFRPPYMPLVHRWEDLKAYQSKVVDAKLKNAGLALLAFLTPIIASSVISLAQTKNTGKVNFDNVWQVFPPSSLVMTKFFGVDTICRVLKYKKLYRRPSDPDGWRIDMEYVDWNGETTGYTTTQLIIRQFNGLRRVTSLPVFPISFLNDVEKTKAAMIERGRKFERLRGYHYMTAHGTKVLLETSKSQQRPVAGKVCVDAYAFYRSCNLVKPKLRPLVPQEGEDEDDGEVEDEDEDQDEDEDEEEAPEDTEMTPADYDNGFAIAPAESASAAKGPAERNEELQPLTSEHCLLATPWMKGFDMKSKDWCELRVDELKPLVWNDEAFDKLVLPGGEKDLAWAFVESKSLSKAEFDDFIPDKGRGLIILML